LYYLKLAEQYEIQALVADACTQTGTVLSEANFPGAANYFNRALKILEQPEYSQSLIHADYLLSIGVIYMVRRDYNEAIQQYKQSLQLAQQLNSSAMVTEIEISLASTYQRQQRYDEALATGFHVLAMLRDSKTQDGMSYVSLILAGPT
jgi:tetratricopeptide (TPR) repeat protein